MTPSPSSALAHGLTKTNTIGTDASNGAVPSGSPSADSLLDGGKLADVPAPQLADEIKPGDGAVTLNGAVAPSKLSRTPSRLVLTSGGLVLELAAMVNGHEVMLPAGSVFTAVQGGHLHVWLKGFKAGNLSNRMGFLDPGSADQADHRVQPSG